MTAAPDQAGVYAVAIILMIASLSAVSLRFKARRIAKLPLKSDDWLVAVSMLFQYALGIMLIYGAARGVVGTHTVTNPQTGQEDVISKDLESSKLNSIEQLIIVLALGTLKCSVVTFYRRIFVRDTFRVMSLIVLILVAAWTIAFFFATVFTCKGGDMAFSWTSRQTYLAYCGIENSVQIAQTSSDVATDLMVLSLPLPEIWRLHMTTRQKLVVSFVFLMGLLSTASGLARLVVNIQAIFHTTRGHRDVRGVDTSLFVWTYVEIGVGVVAACLPMSRPLFDIRGIESVVASVRSMVSLSSLTGTRSNKNVASKSVREPDN